jgi:hypothetical protein
MDIGGKQMLDFSGPVTAVSAVFAVVVGVALERFVTEPPMSDPGPEKPWLDANRRWLRVLFYWSSLTVLASLTLRFLVGSGAHLQQAYVHPYAQVQQVEADLPWFFKDLAFLLFFGVSLVKVALSKNPVDFALWLIRFLGAGLLWSAIEIWRWWPQHDYPGSNWLCINLSQLALTLLALWPLKQKPEWSSYVLAALALSYATIFGIDVRLLIEGRL